MSRFAHTSWETDRHCHAKFWCLKGLWGLSACFALEFASFHFRVNGFQRVRVQASGPFGAQDVSHFSGFQCLNFRV